MWSDGKMNGGISWPPPLPPGLGLYFICLCVQGRHPLWTREGAAKKGCGECEAFPALLLLLLLHPPWMEA